MLKLAIVLLSLTFAGSAIAAGPSREDRRSTLVSLLGAYELKIERAALDTVGRDIPELLMDIANTPREAPRVRVRAIAALAFYPTVHVQSFLRAQLWERNWIGTGLGVQVRRQAMRSLGRGFGEQAVEDIAPLKDDPEPLVREGVALALQDTGSERAVLVLEAWLSQEKSFPVRDKIDRALQKLRGL